MKRLLRLTAAMLFASALSYAQQTPLPEQGSPPTELVERDGFVTANNAPVNTENFEVHVVEAGDTLWDISATYLNNPFLWPQLWETNEHIINPHWIYPGDSVLIRPVTLITEDIAPPPSPPAPAAEPQPVSPPQLPARPQLTADALPAPPAVIFNLPDLAPVSDVKAADLYCSGFIANGEVSRDRSVIAKFPMNESVIASEADYVYINSGSSVGISAGDMFTAVRRTRGVRSTRDNVGDLGTHYLELGQMRVVMVQPGFAMARVVQSCDGIEVGDGIVPFQEIDFPELPANRPFHPMMPSTGKTAGAIVLSRDVVANSGTSIFRGTAVVPGVGGRRLGRISQGIVGEGQIVYIDLGNRDGIRSGDLFLIYRPLDSISTLYKLSNESERLLADQRQVIGELVVLKVEDRSATALVTFSSDGVSPGDLVELR